MKDLGSASKAKNGKSSVAKKLLSEVDQAKADHDREFKNILKHLRSW